MSQKPVQRASLGLISASSPKLPMSTRFAGAEIRCAIHALAGTRLSFRQQRVARMLIRVRLVQDRRVVFSEATERAWRWPPQAVRHCIFAGIHALPPTKSTTRASNKYMPEIDVMSRVKLIILVSWLLVDRGLEKSGVYQLSNT